MSYRHSILATLYPFYRFKNQVQKSCGLIQTRRLRILLYHDIPPDNVKQFSQQLHWLSKRWSFISPNLFAKFLSGETQLKEDSLLLTFDDGYSSNLEASVKVLKPMGIQALFFVIPQFIETEDKESSHLFIQNNLFPDIKITSIRDHSRSMTWKELEQLLELGHSIGSHTFSHARLSEISDEEVLKKEIISSGNKIESNLGMKVDHFAYTFGNLESISPTALKIAKQRYKYVYSGLRGDNCGVSSFALRRDSVSPADSLGLVGSFLEGAVDFLYEKSCRELDAWV
ncbi:polysaccharide deacetylase family protein [bacterium]|nr:polysaccharide deacetylase family protein [bacterium]